MKFVIDAQLPRLLARNLSAAGYPSLHVRDRLPPEVSDLGVARFANGIDASIMSKDADFFDLASRRVLTETLVWLRCGNLAPDDLWRLVEINLAAIVAAANDAHVVFIVR